MRSKVKNLITITLVTVMLLITGCSAIEESKDFEYYVCESCYKYIKKGRYFCSICGDYNNKVGRGDYIEYFSTTDKEDTHWQTQKRWTHYFEDLLIEHDVDRTSFGPIADFMLENKELVDEAIKKDQDEKRELLYKLH